ncbi:MAG: energy-coupling factor transporter transmembrane protein EcfT [FCB group bacterium]|nr:energy-coupling factor transporter transmembrane protein EcfT [FCB group bacterium]
MPLIDDITIGRYQARDSFIHRLDPRTKGFCVILFMTATFGVNGIWGLAGGIVTAALLVVFSKVGFRDFSRNIKAFVWLFVITFALHLFFSPSGEMIEIPFIGWEVSRTGLENGFFYSVRILLLLAFSYLFMAATSPLEIADGLEKTLKPLKKIGFPASEAALILSIALRFVPTLLDEARRIKDAQVCRGARLDGNIFLKIKVFSSMLIPLFASALRRADNLALAIEARGYTGGDGRTSFVELRFKTTDLVALLLTVITITSLVII